MKNVILTDIDGVVLDWETAFHTWMEHQGYQGNRLTYCIGENFSISREVAKEKIRTFNASAAIGFLPPLRDAQPFLRKISDTYWYTFIAITSLSNDPYAQKLRTRNLKKLFGEDTFSEYIYLDTGADKDDILKEMGEKYPGAIWLEDKPENYLAGEKTGLNSYLMEHKHNMDLPKEIYGESVRYVRNWREVYKMLAEE